LKYEGVMAGGKVEFKYGGGMEGREGKNEV
jgi:hypothetical protein